MKHSLMTALGRIGSGLLVHGHDPTSMRYLVGPRAAIDGTVCVEQPSTYSLADSCPPAALASCSTSPPGDTLLPCPDRASSESEDDVFLLLLRRGGDSDGTSRRCPCRPSLSLRLPLPWSWRPLRTSARGLPSWEGDRLWRRCASSRGCGLCDCEVDPNLECDRDLNGRLGFFDGSAERGRRARLVLLSAGERLLEIDLLRLFGLGDGVLESSDVHLWRPCPFLALRGEVDRSDRSRLRVRDALLDRVRDLLLRARRGGDLERDRGAPRPWYERRGGGERL